jgi:hypothetical protein
MDCVLAPDFILPTPDQPLRWGKGVTVVQLRFSPRESRRFSGYKGRFFRGDAPAHV